jgi:hypothetical protein
MNSDREPERTAQLAASACSIEIFVHQILFFFVLLPFALVVLPFLGAHIGVSLVNSNLSSDWRLWRGLPGQDQAGLLNDAWELKIAFLLTFLSATATAVRYRSRLRHFESDSPDGRSYRRAEAGRGDALRLRVEGLWSRVAAPGASCPAVSWFPNVCVLANAMMRSGHSTIAVSTGLWERLELGDPIAEIVLLHELAHLHERDAARFTCWKALLDATNRTLRLLLSALFAIIVFLLGNQLVLDLEAHARPGAIARHEIMVAAIGLLALSLIPVMAAMIRRYLGLLTSLVELRADVRSAQWMGGLTRFADILGENPMVHKSDLSDRRRSWFSLDLTHLSETERVEIVRNPERLFTPKIQYFLFSLLLALVLPLNGVTPLFEGGIADLGVVVIVGLALTVAVCAMLIVAGGTTARISGRRLFALAAALTAFVAACQLNLYTVTYSLSTIAVEIGLPGAGALSSRTFLADLASSFHDIAGQVVRIWSRGWVVASMAITTSTLVGLRSAAKLRPARCDSVRVLAAAGAASGLGVVIDGYDPWRAYVLDHTAIGGIFTAWHALVGRVPAARFTLGPCLGLLCMCVILIFTLRKDPS